MMSISWNSLPVEMTYRMLDQLTGKPFFLSIANVGQTLEQNTTLDQEIKYEGMKYLSTSLRYNTTLEQFYFKFNIIGVEGVRYITVLLSFNIGNNYISKTSLEFLKTKLCSICTQNYSHMPSNLSLPLLSSRLDDQRSDSNFQKSCRTILKKTKPIETRLLKNILAFNNPDKTTIEDNDKVYAWYFAIGSMTNPISLYLRDLTPLLSYPAKCLDYRLVFRAPCGMADIQACQGEEFHGVVHLLALDQLLRLDQIEHMYTRETVRVVDYQQRSHLVYAYQIRFIDGQERPIALPTERYLDIIVKGCEYFGVSPSHINHLKSNQAVTPRRSTDAYRIIKNVPENVYFTKEQLSEHDGTNPLLPIWISINGKVLEYSGLPNEDHPDYENQKQFYEFTLSSLSGREIAHIISKAWYEPLYELPLNEHDLTDEHRAFVEDMCICWGIHVDDDNTNKHSYWKPIGKLVKM